MNIEQILVGAIIGLLIGLTGTGGGSLMTPFLVFYGVPVQTAIGTDLLYAAITKVFGLRYHHRMGNISSDIVFKLFGGSLIGILLASLLLGFGNNEVTESLMLTGLGFMLIISALLTFYQSRLKIPVKWATAERKNYVLIFSGLLLGFVVSLTSVGVAITGVALLMILFPQMPPLRVIGTNMAFATPLAVIAGISHWLLGSVDFSLLFSLLAGSIPAVMVGVRLGNWLPRRIMHNLLVCILFLSGARLILV